MFHFRLEIMGKPNIEGNNNPWSLFFEKRLKKAKKNSLKTNNFWNREVQNLRMTQLDKNNQRV